MKKFVSLLTVMCLVFMATISIQAQETSEPKRITSGQKSIWQSIIWRMGRIRNSSIRRG